MGNCRNKQGIVLASLFLQIVFTQCSDYGTARHVLETLSNFYYNNGTTLTRIIPVEDLSQPIGLTLTMALYSIDKFDAITGQVEITGSLFQEWTDKTQVSAIGNFNFTGIQEGYSVLISPNSIWTPTVVLLNAVDTIERVGDPAYKIRYQVLDGRAKWQPRTLLKASCTPDIRYYPFDRQECSFTYTAWGYTSEEVYLESAQSDWYMCDYTPNGVWTLIETKADIEIKNGAQQLTFTFKIERKPLFFVINVVFPVLLLGFLNGFVFLIPPDCGERIGFAITCFLTMVFMLQTVLTFLPHTADPMSIFCFYMVVMMVMSIAVALVTVIVLRIHFKKDSGEVPTWLKKFIRFVTFVQCKIWYRRVKKKVLTKLGKDKSKSTVSLKDEDIEVDTQSTENTSEKQLKLPSSDTKPRRRIATPGPSKSTKPTEKKVDIDKGSVHDDRSSIYSNGDSIHDDDDDEYKDIDNIEWSDVSKILDYFFFAAFIGSQATLAIIFLVPLATGAT